jgi:hypothetical protein
MFEITTPESIGVSSKQVLRFYKKLEQRRMTVHSILMMRGDKIFTEAYWKPFNQDFCHRMYSVTKSFVGVAIGILEQEGKIKLTDKIADYFRDKIQSRNTNSSPADDTFICRILHIFFLRKKG